MGCRATPGHPILRELISRIGREHKERRGPDEGAAVGALGGQLGGILGFLGGAEAASLQKALDKRT
jgi:hypothetical protein